jgi:hypothetical protein
MLNDIRFIYSFIEMSKTNIFFKVKFSTILSFRRNLNPQLNHSFRFLRSVKKNYKKQQYVFLFKSRR